MILPKTNLSILMVRNAVGYPSTDLGTLCSCDKVNIYSRFRPGYWTTSGTDLVFQKPRGDDYADPRGSDRNGFTTEVYKLGDFRGYNSTIAGPILLGQNPRELTISSSYNGSTISTEVTLDIGEVDWFGDEPEYWGRNNVGVMTQIIAVDSSTSQVLGICEKANLETDATARKRANFTLNIPTPSSAGGTKTTTIKFALGDTGKPRYYFPQTLIVNVRRISNPVYTIYADASGLASIYDQIKGYLEPNDTKVNSVNFEPVNGTFPSGSTTLSYTTTETTVIAYPSFGKYLLTSLRLGIDYTVEVLDLNTNSVVNTWDGSTVLASAADGKYRVIIPLNTTSRDGLSYRIKITKFEDAFVIPY